VQVPLRGIRVHLSGSIPEDATEEQSKSISLFVERFAQAVLRDGGTLIHGSHPSFSMPLKAAAGRFVAAGGSRDALILVRAQKYATTSAQFHEIEAQRQYSTVQIVPAVVARRKSKPGPYPGMDGRTVRCRSSDWRTTLGCK
jgi:hypothetical protein